ncbi:hypothetical protein CTZ27_15025 [Streptomyces griseocarneus]|nr:hypothetical protein CTZ27_15025 [Streptomyces griseocarneus]
MTGGGGEVISLPLSSGPGGVVVGGVTDRCPECVRLRAERHAAWAARDYLREIAARHRWFTHEEQAHPRRFP